MTYNNAKTILFAGLIAAMILPFSVMDISAVTSEFANDKVVEKGKLYIKDKNDLKDLTKENFAQLENTDSKISDIKTKEIRANIDKIGDNMKSLYEIDDIWVISVGTDYENESVNIAIDRTGLTMDTIPHIEKKLREIVGQDTDITISFTEPLYLAGCSQTGQCNPIEGGTRIYVGTELCSMGYRATYNGISGFVTAGHCSSGNTGTSVSNPSSFWWDTLGTVTANDFEDGTWCDCAFVSNNESTSPNVYNGQAVSGTLYPTLYDWLEFEGTITQGSQGGIIDTYEHINPKVCETCPTVAIYGVVSTTASTIGGDSGGSVIESTTSIPKFAGTIITDGGHYTPYYRIANAFPGLILG